ncbi:hypothetical protein BC938DRAFT_483426 [Jimgerdemannia flammicorona]|uniref:Peptidase M12A domain-containing protein n=1 Tax=Jimgerdemannia flammicorona TaxID=994334 RepID=A0A433QVV4_9FUNG|nr:hypothetical protein BC938DRAFT_483426 [Jimgerdemannia flammicorona]
MKKPSLACIISLVVMFRAVMVQADEDNERPHSAATNAVVVPYSAGADIPVPHPTTPQPTATPQPTNNPATTIAATIARRRTSRFERVPFYVTPGNLTVIDGDIVFDKFHNFKKYARIINPDNVPLGVNLCPCSEYAPEAGVYPKPYGAGLTLHPAPENLWPNATIVYKYCSHEVKNKVQKYVDKAIERWRRKSSFLQFEEVGVCCEEVPGQLTIDSMNCANCIATYGYSATEPLYMNLQQPSYCKPPGLSNKGCFEDDATHLFGHVLGLNHETLRADRNEHQEFHCENVLDFHPKNHSCESDNCLGLACAFRISHDYKPYGVYDIDSIMQFPAHMFAKSGRMTLQDKPGTGEHVPRYMRGSPSIGDRVRVGELYGLECKF